jgi:exodeoxyribonuclease-3
MKLVTWNVNSVRARLPRVLEWLERQQPDVVLLQEIKCLDEQFPREAIEDLGYQVETHGQKTYNGVAILSKHRIEDVTRGFGEEVELGSGSRAIGALIQGVRVLDLYVVNGKEVGDPKFDMKMEWMRRLKEHLAAEYDPKEQVVITGDFNVTFDDRDVYDPDGWRDKIHCSDEERAAMKNLMAFGLDDLFRTKHDEGGIYTWWNYKAGAAFKDEGLRIDYILSSPTLTARCAEIIVHKEERTKKSPSDHVPVTAVFGD